MYRLLIIIMLLGKSGLLLSQPFLHKQWDRRFGGMENDALSYLLKDEHGNVYTIGNSYSGKDGDKSEPNRDPVFKTLDAYVVKIDAQGNKLWDKRYGGINHDWFSAGVITPDKHLVFAGITYSGVDGDVSQPSRGANDYWLLKADTNGNKIWDKRFGGTSNDLLRVLIQTTDKGFLLGGSSYSSIGFEKTEPNRGSSPYDGQDYWIVKTDSAGNKQWDRTFGGTKNDFLRALLQTRDGGYLLGGHSTSRSGADKTQDNWDTIQNPTTTDVWLVRIDSAGNKLWDRSLGTTLSDEISSITETKSGDILLMCGAFLDDGDKNTGSNGIWFVKLEASGNAILHQSTLNMGSNMPYVYFTADGGYLLAALAYRTDNLIGLPTDRTEDCLGQRNTVVLKLDSNLNKEWDRTILTPGSDFDGYAIQTDDGCYVVANNSRAIVGGYKSQPPWGGSIDIFIMKFCMDTISGIGSSGSAAIGFTAYPNPFGSALNISITSPQLTQATFTLTNALGQAIYRSNETQLAPAYTKTLDLSYLPKGIYFVEVETPTDGKAVQRVVKE